MKTLHPRELRKSPAPARERRMVIAKVEIRALTEAEQAEGYIGALTGIIPLNSDSVSLRDRRMNGGQPFVERIAPKAFAGAEDVVGVAGHTDDPLAAFGRTGANLTLVESATELRWDAKLPNTSAARDLLELGAKNIIRGTSFEFEVGAEDKWEKRDDGTAVRTVIKGNLSRVNPVINPAYDDSDLTVSLRERGGEGEIRGYYASESGIVDYCDPTITPDAKFAGCALNRATYALTDALEYLRAAPAGLLSEYAQAEVGAAAVNAKTLIDWLAANGATVNPAAQQRAEEKLQEAREATARNLPQPSDRERRLRILTK